MTKNEEFSDDNRKEGRIDIEDLPESLQHVQILTDQTHSFHGETKNASCNGMGFLVDHIHTEDISIDQEIIVKDVESSFELKANVIYINKIDDETLQVGIEFDGDETTKAYQYLVIPDTSY